LNQRHRAAGRQRPRGHVHPASPGGTGLADRVAGRYPRADMGRWYQAPPAAGPEAGRDGAVVVDADERDLLGGERPEHAGPQRRGGRRPVVEPDHQVRLPAEGPASLLVGRAADQPQEDRSGERSGE
jgi:hypothetical protein